jgi:hypothetical protein
MNDREDLEPDLTDAERSRLTAMGERLERDRPLPRPAFRGDLRRSLMAARPGSRVAAGASRWRVLVATYSGLGAVLLAVAAVGLAGVGPFGA